MSEFVWLRKKDKLPAVAVAQLLLNRTGATLTVDGDFGRRTDAAVRGFQRQRSLGVDGIIGKNTWPRLKSAEQLQVLDSIDVFDPNLYQIEASRLRREGCNPLLIGGMTNGIEQAVSQIRGASRKLFLLRFHGHGAPGVAGVSDGHGEFEDHSSFRNDSASRRALSGLRGCFGPYGCIQFMQCNVAQGAAGASFLNMVATTVGVPVTAGRPTQYGGNLREILTIEGQTRTVLPSGGTLPNWAHGLPEFIGMSVR